jgi:hypothetical protein
VGEQEYMNGFSNIFSRKKIRNRFSPKGKREGGGREGEEERERERKRQREREKESTRVEEEDVARHEF